VILRLPCYSEGMEKSSPGGILIGDSLQLAEALRFVRTLAGLSQRALAARSGFRQAQIGDWENHIRSPQIDSLTRLADSLGYDVMLVPRKDGS
jgi:predicted transcriptional regulator